MSILWNDRNLINAVDKKLFASLDAVGEFLVTEAKHRAPVDRGLLRSSIDKAVYPNKTVRVSAFSQYAVIQELGGTIRPDKANNLAIPVHQKAVKWSQSNGNKSINDFPIPLTFIKRKGKPSLLVRETKGKNKRTEIMFVLVKSVRIKAQPYLRPALLENKTKIMRIFGNGYK